MHQKPSERPTGGTVKTIAKQFLTPHRVYKYILALSGVKNVEPLQLLAYRVRCGVKNKTYYI